MIIDLCRDLTRESNEREAILVSGTTLETAKLLGAPRLPDATGNVQFKAVKELLEYWNIYHGYIGKAFDATASNTGRWKVKGSRRRKVLVCLTPSHVADLVFGQRNSPSLTLFRQFKDLYPQLDNDPSKHCLLDHSLLASELDEQAESVLKWVEECLLENTFPRED